MRDGDDRPIPGDARDGFPDLLLRFHIHGSGCLVQDDDRRVSQNCPGDGDALLLSAGQAQSPLADLRIISVRHEDDVLMNIGGLCRFHDFLHGGLRHGVTDVFRDRAVEEERVLQDRRDVPAQAFERHAADIVPVDQDIPGRRFVEAGDQLRQGGLADARRADDRQHFPGPADEGDILQHGNAVPIGKADMIKRDLALDGGKNFGAVQVPDLLRRIENIQDALRTGHGLLQAFQEVGQACHRRVEEPQIQEESHDIRHAQAFLPGQVSAEAYHQDRSQGGDKLDGGMEHGADLQRLQHGADVFEVPRVHLPGFIFFPPEGLDLMNAGEIILQFPVQLAHFLLGDPEIGPDLFGEHKSGGEDQRERRAGNQRQFPVDGQQDDQDPRKGNQVGDRLRNQMRVKQFEITGVIHDPAHQVAGLLIMEITQVHMLQLVVGSGPQIAHQIPGGLVGQIVAQKPEQDPEQVQTDQHGRKDQNGTHAFFIHTRLHDSRHVGQDFRCGQVHQGQRQRGQDRNGIKRPVPNGFTAEPQESLGHCLPPWVMF